MILDGEVADRHQARHSAGVVAVGNVSEYLGFTGREPVATGEDVPTFRRRTGLHRHHHVSLLKRFRAPETVRAKGQPCAAAKVDPRLRRVGIDASFGREKLGGHVVCACRYGASSGLRRHECGEPVTGLGRLGADGQRR